MIHAADAAGAFVRALTFQPRPRAAGHLRSSRAELSRRDLAAIVARTLPFEVDVTGASTLPAGGGENDAFQGQAPGSELLFNATAITAQQAVMEIYIALVLGRTHPSFVTRGAGVYRAMVTEGRLTATRFLDPAPTAAALPRSPARVSAVRWQRPGCRLRPRRRTTPSGPSRPPPSGIRHSLPHYQPSASSSAPEVSEDSATMAKIAKSFKA